MADRQGLFRQRSLNPVQQYALQVLMALEKRDKIEDEVAAFKRALVGNSPELAEELFPDYFPPEDLVVNDDFDITSITGEIEFVSEGTEQMTPELMREILKKFNN